jgi:hypothetical protein
MDNFGLAQAKYRPRYAHQRAKKGDHVRALLRLAAVTSAAGLLLAPAAAAAASAGQLPATHAITVHLRGGTTKLTLVTGLTSTLISGGIVPIATQPASQTLLNSHQLRFSFPVSGGRVSVPSFHGSIDHRGGILFVNISNGDTLKVSRLTINLTHKRLSGIVSAVGIRVILAKLGFSHARLRAGLHRATASRIGVHLTTAAADALDTALGTTLFTPGMKIATLATLVRY